MARKWLIWKTMNTLPQLDPEAFWVRVIPEPNCGCWLWTGAVTPSGYGKLKIGGRKGKFWVASRVAWSLHFGPIPSGLFVCHRCDNPPCCNPDHLFLGSHKENMQDCSKKRRCSSHRNPVAARAFMRNATQVRSGSLHPRSRLTEDMCEKIREMQGSQVALAAMFGVSPSTIWSIRSGKRKPSSVRPLAEEQEAA